MGLDFNVIAATGEGGRRGQLSLPHQIVETPVFMPVGTAGTVKAVPQDVLESLGVEIVLGNTYHLYLRPGHEPIRRMGGLHRFMSWPRALLTDSGGFQVFSLSQLRKVTDEGVRFRSHLDGSSHFFTPEHSMDVQIALGADIAMAFDECTEYPADRDRATESLRLTMVWARRSLDHFRAHREEVRGTTSWSGRTQSLFGIVQGGMYRDLRHESAERLVEMDFDGYAIGGLSVGEPRDLTMEMIAEVLPLLPADKPRYVMGVGYPDEIEQYAAHGRGHDGLRAAHARRASRTALHQRGAAEHQGQKVRRRSGTAGPSLPVHGVPPLLPCLPAPPDAGRRGISGTLNTIHNLAYYLGIMQRVRAQLMSGGAESPIPADVGETPSSRQ